MASISKQSNIAVILGGWSAEREVSIKSGQACSQALLSAGYNVTEIDADHNLPSQLTEHSIDCAFLALHGKYGEDGCIQGLLETMGIPYTGSNVKASAVAMDKVISKHLFALHDLPTPAFEVIRSKNAPQPSFGFPAVVKPNNEGSSVGIKIVKTQDAYQIAIEEALQWDQQVLVEQFIQGREITVGLLNGKPLAALEIVVSQQEFYDYQAKYNSTDNKYIVPAPINDDIRNTCFTIAKKACEILGCSGAPRADFLLDESDHNNPRVYLLEVNTLPGMTTASLLPKIAQSQGINFEQLCEQILLTATCLSPLGQRSNNE